MVPLLPTSIVIVSVGPLAGPRRSFAVFIPPMIIPWGGGVTVRSMPVA